MNERERAELELKAFVALAAGQRLVVDALRACEVLTVDNVAERSPAFWMAVGQIQGVAAICGHPGSVGRVIEEVRSVIGGPESFAAPVADALRAMYEAADKCRDIAKSLRSRPETGQEPTAAAGSPESPDLKDGKEVTQQS